MVLPLRIFDQEHVGIELVDEPRRDVLIVVPGPTQRPLDAENERSEADVYRRRHAVGLGRAKASVLCGDRRVELFCKIDPEAR